MLASQAATALIGSAGTAHERAGRWRSRRGPLGREVSRQGLSRVLGRLGRLNGLIGRLGEPRKLFRQVADGPLFDAEAWIGAGPLGAGASGRSCGEVALALSLGGLDPSGQVAHLLLGPLVLPDASPEVEIDDAVTAGQPVELVAGHGPFQLVEPLQAPVERAELGKTLGSQGVIRFRGWAGQVATMILFLLLVVAISLPVRPVLLLFGGALLALMASRRVLLEGRFRLGWSDSLRAALAFQFRQEDGGRLFVASEIRICNVRNLHFRFGCIAGVGGSGLMAVGWLLLAASGRGRWDFEGLADLLRAGDLSAGQTGHQVFGIAGQPLVATHFGFRRLAGSRRSVVFAALRGLLTIRLTEFGLGDGLPLLEVNIEGRLGFVAAGRLLLGNGSRLEWRKRWESWKGRKGRKRPAARARSRLSGRASRRLRLGRPLRLRWNVDDHHILNGIFVLVLMLGRMAAIRRPGSVFFERKESAVRRAGRGRRRGRGFVALLPAGYARLDPAPSFALAAAGSPAAGRRWTRGALACLRRAPLIPSEHPQQAEAVQPAGKGRRNGEKSSTVRMLFRGFEADVAPRIGNPALPAEPKADCFDVRRMDFFFGGGKRLVAQLKKEALSYVKERKKKKTFRPEVVSNEKTKQNQQAHDVIRGKTNEKLYKEKNFPFFCLFG